MHECSSAADDSMEDEYEDERSSEGGGRGGGGEADSAGQQDLNDSRMTDDVDDELSNSPIKGGFGKGTAAAAAAIFDDHNGDGPEPGKYNFQLLPGHCVLGRQGNKLYKCDICGGVYRHAFSLKRHYLRTHVNYDYLSLSDIANCNINMETCTKEKGESDANRNNAFFSHLPPSDVYRCHICGSLFADVYNLKDHIVNHPNNTFSKRFCCTLCDMTFSHKQNLVRHLSVHSGVKPYACKHCGKAFPTATNQRRHERIHQGVKPYLCPHCQSNFSQSGDLKKHIRKLHREFFHPCAFCMKYFAHRTELQEHVVSHGKTLELNHKVLDKKLEEKVSSVPVATATALTVMMGMAPESSESSSCSNEVPHQPPPLTVVTSLTRDSPSSAAESARRFCCSVCDKRFHTNVKLQRHRNIAHPRPGSLVATRRITRRSPETVQLYDRCAEPSPFFANVSQNIAHNLQYYLDGKLSQELVVGSAAGAIESSNTPPSSSSSSQCRNSNSVFVEQERARGFSVLNSCGESPEPSDDGDLPHHQHNHHHRHRSSILLDLSVNRVHHGYPLADDELSSGDDGDNEDIPIVTKAPPSKFLCHACGECFATLLLIEEHKVNNHPNVHCTHVEVDNTKGDVPLDLFKYQCSPEGVLLKCPTMPAIDAFKPRCTKCSETFGSSGELHEHILACGGHVDGRDVRQGCARMSKRVVRRGMKRCLDISDDTSNAQKRRFRKPRKEAFWDWLPAPEQQQQQQPQQQQQQQSQPQPQQQSHLQPEVKQISQAATVMTTTTSSSFADKSSNETALMCDGCNQKFKYISALERHQKFCLTEALHRGQKARELRHLEHCCPYCARHFTYPASLKKHVLDSCPLKGSSSNSAAAEVAATAVTVVSKTPIAEPMKKTKVKSKTKLGGGGGTSLISVQKVAKLAAKKQEKRAPKGSSAAALVSVVTKRTLVKKEIAEDAVGQVENPVAVVHIRRLPSTVKKETRVMIASMSPTAEDDMNSSGNAKGTAGVKPPLEAAAAAAVIAPASPLQLPPGSPSASPPPLAPSPPPPPLRSRPRTSSPQIPKAPSPPPSPSPPPPSPPIPIPGVPPSTSVLPLTSLSKVLSDKMKGGLMGLLTQSAHRPDYFACPDCKRTFTYLANFKKHLNVLCPLRSQKDEDGDLKKEDDDDDEDADDDEELDPAYAFSRVEEDEENEGEGDVEGGRNAAAGTSHKCSVCHKSFNEYVEMLKHRLLHKLKNSGTGSGTTGVGSTLKSRVGRTVRPPARLVNGRGGGGGGGGGGGTGRGRGRGRGRGGGGLKRNFIIPKKSAASSKQVRNGGAGQLMSAVPLRRGCRVRKPSAAAKLGMDNVSLIDDDDDSEDIDELEAAELDDLLDGKKSNISAAVVADGSQDDADKVNEQPEVGSAASTAS